MAVFKGANVTAVYELARRFRDECIVQDGSLIDAQEIWTAEALDRLHKAFVDTPDLSERSFMDKFRDQIAPLGPSGIRLAGEVLSVYFLFPSSVSGKRKLQVVNEILAWGSEAVPANSALIPAFGQGIGGAGQGYNTRRPYEAGYLIELVRRLKSLDQDARRRIVSDPWEFRRYAFEADEGQSRQLRHMLLHLLFPEQFERIGSASHKRQIVETFGGLVGDEFDNEDQRLLAIRQRLENALPGQALDFYRAPLLAAWSDNSGDDASDAASLELIRHKKQIVLYGPPGTGKTHQAKRIAATLIHSAAMKRWGVAEYFQSASKLEAAVEANVHRLQLHPAYSYEDFVRGLHLGEQGRTEYRPGYLLRLIDKINETPREQRLPHVLILDEMNRTDLTRMLGECFSLLENRNETVDLPAHRGDGAAMRLRIPDDLYVIGTMNLIDQSVEQIDFALRRRFLWILCPFNASALLEAAKHRWETLGARLDWDQVASEFQRLAAAAANLNADIAKNTLLGPQYEIGHTYFLDTVAFWHNAMESGCKVLWGKNNEPALPVRQVWQLSLRPLLEQYLAGLDARVREDQLKQLQEKFLKTMADA